MQLEKGNLTSRRTRSAERGVMIVLTAGKLLIAFDTHTLKQYSEITRVVMMISMVVLTDKKLPVKTNNYQSVPYAWKY
jgi:hypothetical protein